MRVVLVHHGDVVIHVFAVGIHAAQPVVDDDGQFVGIGRVIRDAIGDGGRQQVAVAVLVLQSLPGQGGPAGGAADEKAAGTHIAGRPGKVADPLESEHGVEDIERYHLHPVVFVRRSGRYP